MELIIYKENNVYFGGGGKLLHVARYSMIWQKE